MYSSLDFTALKMSTFFVCGPSNFWFILGHFRDVLSITIELFVCCCFLCFFFYLFAVAPLNPLNKKKLRSSVVNCNVYFVQIVL